MGDGSDGEQASNPGESAPNQDTESVDTEGDDASAERQLFGDRRETHDAIIACKLGVGQASVAADRVGQASILTGCHAMSVTADERHVVVGTKSGVLVDDGTGFEQRGPSSEIAAVGSLSGETRTLFAATATGQVLTSDDGQSWHDVGTVDAPQRFCGPFLAAGDGVYRVDDALESLGRSVAHDVAIMPESSTNRCDSDDFTASGETAVTLFTATEDGLFRRTVGDDDAEWVSEHDRPTTTVVAAKDRAHAVDDRGVIERAEGAWIRRAIPEDPVDLGYGDGLCGVTADGALLLDAVTDTAGDDQNGWRTHPLGLRGVTELAVR